MDLAAQYIGQGRRDTAIRDVRHREARAARKQLGGEVRDAASAGCRIGEVRAFRPAERDQVLQRFDRGLRADNKYVLDIRDLRDRRKLPHFVGQIGEQRRIHGSVAHWHQGERVPIRRGLGYCGHGNIAVGPGPVLHHHRLAPLLRQAVADDPCQRIGRTAGGEAHDDTDLSRRIIRLVRRGDCGRGRHQKQGCGQQSCGERHCFMHHISW
jgi:hypothetical protein